MEVSGPADTLQVQIKILLYACLIVPYIILVLKTGLHAGDVVGRCKIEACWFPLVFPFYGVPFKRRVQSVDLPCLRLHLFFASDFKLLRLWQSLLQTIDQAMSRCNSSSAMFTRHGGLMFT
jgi:hypothetical protein